MATTRFAVAMVSVASTPWYQLLLLSVLQLTQLKNIQNVLLLESEGRWIVR
jgi:hypothetical protein